jgi:hypothetical protein
MRFPDFLRTAVLLFAGAATALAAATIAAATADDNRLLISVSLGWWALSTLIGGYLGRRRSASAAIEQLMANARASSAVPELEPGTILFNRLWPLALFTIGGGGVAFLLPQVPAFATGFALILALLWRNQASAVEAVEGRDGVQFYVDSGSPFRATQLIRTPGFQRIEPA